MEIRNLVGAAGFSLALSILAATNTRAQCATGVNTGGGNCVPPDASGMPGYNTAPAQAPAPPKPVWQDSWGAIAIDEYSGDAGTITNRNTKASAVGDAMSDCTARGAKHCEVVLTYYNQCAAVAWSNNSYGAATDASQQVAERDALNSCRKAGMECKVVYSACSQPKRIR